MDVSTAKEVGSWLLLLVGGPSGAAAIVKGLRSSRTFRSTVVEGLEKQAVGIEDIKNSVRRLDALSRVEADSAPHPVFFVCDKGVVTFVSRRFASQFGWERDDLLGKGWLNVIHPLDRVRVEHEWDEGVGQKRFFTIDARAIHRTLREADRTVTIQAEVMRCHDGEFFGWRGMVVTS